MKNRLLPALFLLLNLCILQAQNGPLSVTMEPIPSCGCDGCFIVTVSNGQPPYGFMWSNGQVNTSSLSTVMYCGFCPGQYHVTVTNGTTQQTATATGILAYSPPFPVDIISLNTAPCNQDSLGGNQDCEQVCAGSTVTYTLSNNLPVTGGSVTWTVSGASSWVADPTTGKSVTVTWGNPGAGSVQVFSNTAPNCPGEDYICVTILEPPTAKIASNPAAPSGGVLQICKGQVVDFQNLSSGDADTYEWYFSDDLSGSSAADPHHTYLNAGTNTVTLIARSHCLCSDTTTMTVEVMDAVAPTLDCVATICPGETVNYTASNACAPFSWNISANGTILEGGTATSDSITVHWNNGPDGIISLSAAACSGATCPTAGIIHIPIISDNAEIRGEEEVCPGSTEVYSIESFGGAGFVWTLSGGGYIAEGQGTNRVSVNWQNAASTSTTFWLSVKYDNCYLGCGGQDSIPVKILSSFVVNGPVEACLNTNSTFTAKLVNTNGALPCNWALSGPSGNTVWTSSSAAASVSVPFSDGPGYYRLFATPGAPGQTCSDQADWAIHVNPQPVKLTGIKGELKICPGITYTYEAEGGGPQSNYLWTVQNGASGPFFFPGKTLNVSWNASGPRWLAVAHVSTDGLSCQSDTIQIQVTSIGIPNITGVPMVCEDTKGNYAIAPLQNVDLQWQINPSTAGSVASGQGTNTAEIYWSQPGVHNVNLNVCGQTAVFPVTVLANPDPVVQAPAGLCPGATGVVQTASSYAGYTWKNDAGAILLTAATPVLGAGNYAVAVVDGNGCAGTREFFIDSWDAPDVSLTTASPTGFCNNSLFVPLTALINVDGDYTFQWFQDGVLLPGQTATTYSTNQYGNYTVQATNAHGCTSIAGPIRLFEYCGGGGPCTGQPCSGDLCPPNTVEIAIDPTARCDSFQMHLLDPNGVFKHGTANWVVGISGGVFLGSSSSTDPSFTFNNAGEYVAVLTVELTDGNICNVYEFFGAEAVARFDVLPACPGESTEFQDVSEYLPSGGISNWAWTFGDPASGVDNLSSVRNATHTYAPAGNYDVMLTVTGASGCTSSTTQAIKIPDLPNMTFAEPAFKCAGNALEFAPPPNAADITEISWDFGDPTSGASNDATGSPSYHNFSPAGNYTVTATATNIYGCTASFSRNIAIPPNTLTGTITPPVPPAICEGSSITLTAPPGGVSYLWSDDNATTATTLTVNSEGSYRVTLTDANGCTYAPPAVKVELNTAPDAVIKALLMNELNQVVGVSYPSLAVCEGEDVTLQAFSNGSANYSWSVSNGNNPYLYYTDDRNTLLSTGNYTYTVTITNPATGCTAVSAPFSVTVNPVPGFVYVSGTSSCAGNPTTISYNGPQPPNWQLIWNTGLSGPTLTTEEPGQYLIRVINEFGCETRSAPWTLLPGPPVASIPAGCHTRCKPDTLCLPTLPTVIHWQWFQNGSPIPGATTAGFIAQQSGTYWAELTDYYGCTAQSDPLTLNLYDGYGNILGKVWSDVNDNGIIDAGDTLVSGIPVVLYQNGALYDAANSGVNGDFAFPNILSTDYSVQINPFSLPPNWNVVIGQDPVSLSGCDVVGTADLLVHFACQAFGTLQLAACPGTSVTYQGSSIAAGGTLSFHYTSPSGCDSTLVVSVATLQPSTGSATLYACPGSTANYAGVDLAVGATQDFTLTNWHGCDSIVTVQVAPFPVSTGIATLHACPGGTANYAGTDLTVGTTQDFTFTNWLGCDSVVTVTVQAWPVSTGTATLYACQGSTANYAGIDIPAGATQQVTLTNWLGCDSVVTVHVQAWPTSTGSATLLFACSGGSALYEGISIPAGTSQQFTLHTWHGCDSIVTVSVAALPAATGSETLYACPGGTASYDGTLIPEGTSQPFNKTTWLGCDSIVTVTVAAWPTSTGATTLYACPGDMATFEGTSLPVGATQPFTLQNWLGCDSIVTVTVAAWPTSTGATTLYACPGDMATFEGTSLPVGATQPFTLQNWLGCDSIVTVTVAAWPTSTGTKTLFACPGGTANFEGVDIPAGTTQNVPLTNWLGCDSIVAVTVTPWTTVNSGFEVGVCPGESYVYQGMTLTGGTVHPFVLPNWLGCDSIVTVTVKQLHNTANTVDVSVCPGESYIYDGTTLQGGQTRDFHRPNAEGCDSTITVVVTEFPATTFNVQAQRACADAPTGSLEAVVDPGGQPPFQFSLNNTDYQNETSFSDLPAGDYQVFLEDVNGCIFKKTTTIPAIPQLEVQLPNGILPCDSARVTLTPVIVGGDAATLTVDWWNGTRNTTAVATEAGTVWVEATDICGAKRSEAEVKWADLAQDLDIVYVPNVLKPDAIDPENSRFKPLFAAGISLVGMKFMIFDRWGTELFETESTVDSWDGIFDAEEMNPGVYVWYMEADVAICGRILHVVKKGDVTIVR